MTTLLKVRPLLKIYMSMKGELLDDDVQNVRTHHNKIATLLVGNPECNLSYAEEEVKCIQTSIRNNTTSQMMADPVIMYLQDEAKKEEVTAAMEEANFIHLACHGSSDSISSLAGDTTTRAGALTMGEVQELKLNDAKLLVLSACNTFRGELHADGVIGISRALIAAGSPPLLASL